MHSRLQTSTNLVFIKRNTHKHEYSCNLIEKCCFLLVWSSSV